jgi:hypothetical protein
MLGGSALDMNRTPEVTLLLAERRLDRAREELKAAETEYEAAARLVSGHTKISFGGGFFG